MDSFFLPQLPHIKWGKYWHLPRRVLGLIELKHTRRLQECLTQSNSTSS